MKDRHGEDLNVGDRVVFTDGERSANPLIGLVTGFTSTTVRITYKVKRYYYDNEIYEDPNYRECRRESHKVIKI